MGLELDLNNIPDNPEALQKAFEQIHAGGEPEEPAPKEPEQKADEPGTKRVENEPATNDQKQDEPQQLADEGDAAGVATKDGKHVIPYSVLKSERERATRAEQIAREAQERVAKLEQQLQTTPEAAKAAEGAQAQSASDLDQEDLDALKEDFPTVYKAVMASMAAAKALEAKLQPVAESVRNVEAERERSTADLVQEAIDAVPKLAHIQATDPDTFALAKQFDAILRQQRAWDGKPLSERFAKVMAMVEGSIGQIDLPGDSKPKPSPSTEDLAKAARAKAEAAAQASKSAVPTSLSEFPAGHHAAQDEREAVEQLTHQQLAEKFGRMSRDEMDAYFQTL